MTNHCSNHSLRVHVLHLFLFHLFKPEYRNSILIGILDKSHFYNVKVIFKNSKLQACSKKIST